MVIWSTPAKLDLKGIYDYIASDSKFYAAKVAWMGQSVSTHQCDGSKKLLILRYYQVAVL
jgi:hypothetical protein